MNLALSFSQGADIEPAKLTALRHLAPLLPLAKQQKILNELSGQHSSQLRGRGMDYAEVRLYQAGDDLRSMDWRVTARTNKAHIKVFQQEKERPVYIVCDLRRAMHFGSKRALKSVLAADLAALLAWASLNNGDRIGALIFSDDKEVNLRAKPGRKAVLHLLSQLAQIGQARAQMSDQVNDQTSSASANERMQQICRHIRRTVTPGSRVYVISDWLGFDELCQQQLFHVSRHSDIVALHVCDPLEQQLPPPGLYSVTDGENQLQLESFSKAHRHDYQQAYLQQFSQLKQRLLALTVPLVSLSTADPDPLPSLRAGLGISLTNKGRAR